MVESGVGGTRWTTEGHPCFLDVGEQLVMKSWHGGGKSQSPEVVMNPGK